jgi:hypothetical protein
MKEVKYGNWMQVVAAQIAFGGCAKEVFSFGTVFLTVPPLMLTDLPTNIHVGMAYIKHFACI